MEKGGLPVLFWVHGGHHRTGSASQYNPQRIVQKGVVVVTLQYRLGSLGKAFGPPLRIYDDLPLADQML